jgi:hypothetical protein
MAKVLARFCAVPDMIRHQLPKRSTLFRDKVNLRRLQVGTEFQVASQGFRFSTKPGRDIYVIQHPESGWLALTALRPTDHHMNFFPRHG